MPDLPEWSQDRKQRILNALNDRNVRLPCPRCGSPPFALMDGYFMQPVQMDLKGIVMGGPAIPSVVTVCKECGFISQHALGALGLLPEEGDK